MVGIAGANNRRDRSKSFFTEDGHIRRHIGKDGWLVEVTLARSWLPTQQDARAHLERSLYLLLQRVAQITTSHWADLCLAAQRVADAQFACSLDKLALELLGN